MRMAFKSWAGWGGDWHGGEWVKVSTNHSTQLKMPCTICCGVYAANDSERGRRMPTPLSRLPRPVKPEVA